VNQVGLHEGFREMKHAKLPDRLGKSPLLDAIFEFRFMSAVPGSVFLPGFILTKLKGVTNFEKFPTSDIPAPIRQADPNLRYQPLFRLQWNDYLISGGDESFLIACKIPTYPGWANFKPAILSIVKTIFDSPIIQGVTRVSLRYIDLLEGSDVRELLKFIDISIKIGESGVEKDPFGLRIENKQDSLTSVVQVAAIAEVRKLDGSQKRGALIDVDNVLDLKGIPFNEFADKLPPMLEQIHADCKRIFFECLTAEAINFMEPVYDDI